MSKDFTDKCTGHILASSPKKKCWEMLAGLADWLIFFHHRAASPPLGTNVEQKNCLQRLKQQQIDSNNSTIY